MNKVFFFAVLMCACVVCARPVVIHTKAGAINFDVEVADTAKTQKNGLMFRTQLDADKGMIFINEYDQVWNMWMKNTLIPLDMIFVNKAGRIVKIAPNAQPKDLTIISSDIPVRAVLEIGAGQSEKKGIMVGDTAILQPVK